MTCQSLMTFLITAYVRLLPKLADLTKLLYIVYMHNVKGTGIPYMMMMMILLIHL